MRPEADRGPPRLGVQRQFEPNRLAEDCQTRAYAEVLPLERRGEATVTTLSAEELLGKEQVLQGGRAA